MIRGARKRLILGIVWLAGAPFTVGACSSPPPAHTGDAGTIGIGQRSGLPVPPGPGGVPKPSGAPGNLKILDWAGFTSALTYTFDDAQPSQLEHYDELQANGVPFTFFITTNSDYQAGFDALFTRAAMDGHEIGNHTVHHCYANLTGCGSGTATSLESELDDCTAYITSHFGVSDVWTAATPYGDTGYATADAVRFLLNRGVQSGTVGPNDATDPFNLPCHAAVSGETADSFNAAIDGAHAGGRWIIMLVHTLMPTSAVWYAPIDVSVIHDSAAHAKALGDVWIDSMIDVGAYWLAQKLVSGVTPTRSGTVQTWTWTLPPHFPAGKYLRVAVDGGALAQAGVPLAWDPHGYYEVSLDTGALTLGP